MVSLTIDGKTISVPAGTTILEAARQLGIAIPTLCWLEKVSPTGACRICAVEVKGVDRPMTACNTAVKDGIVVTTQSAQLTTIRKQILELILVNHPLDCPVCDAAGECDLQNLTYELEVNRQSFEAEDVNPADINEWPLIQQVPSRCVLCEKCVKVCHETVGSNSLFVNDKGDRAFIDKNLDLCEFCGNCVQVCPTGTMISKTFKFKARPWEMTKVPSVCTQCGSHCQIDVNVKNDKVLRVTSDDQGTINSGNLCIGGFFGHGYVNSSKRLTSAVVRIDGKPQQVSMDQAVDVAASALCQVRDGKGASAIAALGSPQLSNEENYLLQKLFRAAVGTNNIDSEARFGALRGVRALEATVGLKGASNSMEAIGSAKAVLVFGSDVTAEAPAIDWQIERATRKREGKLVLANMRRVKLARYANTFLNYRPGSEAALANALTSIIVEKGLADEANLAKQIKNFDEFKKSLKKVNLKKVCEETGLSAKLIEEAAEYLGKAESVAVVFGADVTRSNAAEQKVAAIANLALVSGALAGEAGGLFPVDEKGNAQGMIDMGVAPELLPGQQDYQGSKSVFEKAWNVTLPSGGLDALGILEAIEKGEVTYLFLAGTNPLVGYPESARWKKALQQLEVLVVQDIFASELTELATVVLPAAAPFEKSGSVTSLDGCVSRFSKAAKAPGESCSDLDILASLYSKVAPGQNVQAAAVQQEIRDLVPAYAEVGACCGGNSRTSVRSGFAPAEGSLTCKVPSSKDEAKGLQLLSGKILFQFGTTTTYSDGTNAVANGGYIEMSPADAETSGVKDGDVIKVSSAVGTASGRVKVSENVQAGLLFAPYHFSDVDVQQVVPCGQNRVAVQVSKA